MHSKSRHTAEWIKSKIDLGWTRDELISRRDLYEVDTARSMTQESWRRRVREAFESGENEESVESLSSVLRRIESRYTESELLALAKGSSDDSKLFGSATVTSFQGSTLKFGVITDLHIGSKYFHPAKLTAAYDMFEEEGIDTILCAGDVVEGMSSRDGHVFECTHIGYDAQREFALELLGKWGGKIYSIDGNHDRWFGKRSGARMVPDIDKLLPNFHFLGHDEGDLLIETPGGTAWIKLWHGEDGSSYAHSYRIQKLIESLTGGQKPHVLITGHVHKQGYFMERNIHTILGGCIQNQSKWMRGKRLPAHTGFWIVSFTVNDDGVTRFLPEWFPFFENHPDQPRAPD